MMNIGFQIEDVNVRERADRTLEKARRQEAKQLSQGYRYVHVSARTRILVECDGDGRPTEKGRSVLEQFNAALL